jgi:insertion element IS1 protein InsB
VLWKSDCPSRPSPGCTKWLRKLSTRFSKKVNQLPPLTETLPPLASDAVEMDELCISLKQNLWLWTAVSRYSGQILAFVISDRGWDNVETLWRQLPKEYQRRLVYTDGYGAYAAFFSGWQHRPCQKFDGGTCTAEGVNQSLRHRCGPLVRRTSAKCRDRNLLQARIQITAAAHNRATPRRIQRRIKSMLRKR